MITVSELRSWRSVSVWDTQEGAEGVARAFPQLGTWIAVLELSDELIPVPFGAAGHWDIEGDPGALVRAVVRVVPVR